MNRSRRPTLETICVTQYMLRGTHTAMHDTPYQIHARYHSPTSKESQIAQILAKVFVRREVEQLLLHVIRHP